MFLNPLMLAGALTISIPIVIHLLNRRKFDRVRWAAMRFLRVSIEQNQRRMKLEDILLLILRCMILLLLAIALARPTLHSSAGMFGLSGITGVIVLDNSYSMSRTDGVASRFDRAKKAAEQVVDSLPGNSSTAVLLASDVVEGAIPEPTVDLHLVRKIIREAKLTDRSTNLLPALQNAIDLLQRKNAGRREVFVVTDGQRLGWRQFEDIRRLLDDTGSDVRFHLILTGEAEEKNLGVSDLRLASGLAPVDRALRFEAQVTNFGVVEERGVRVSLRVDDDPPADEATIDVIPPGQSRSVSVFVKLRSAGPHTVTAAVPADHLPADDARTIALRGVSKINVLLVDGNRSLDQHSGVFFLKNALVPVSAAEADHYFIATRTVTPAELAETNFNEFDAVVMSNVTDFTAPVLEAVTDYVRRGGGLVVFPGPDISQAFYNEQLFARSGLLPAELKETRGDATQEAKFFSLQARNFEHPIATIWNDPAAGSPGNAHVYRAWVFGETKSEIRRTRSETNSKFENPKPETPDSKPDSRNVLSYTDGTPAIMEHALGRGRVVLFSSTADTSWNDLPARPGIFVPLMYRTLGSIVSRQDEALNVRVGEAFVYRPPAEWLGKDVLIRRPGGTDQGRDARRIELVDGSAVLKFDDTGLAGAYTATVAADPPVELKFAAQADKAESNLEELTGDQIDALEDVATVTRWRSGVALDRSVEQERAGTEFWWPLAVLTLILAASETWFAYRFSRAK